MESFKTKENNVWQINRDYPEWMTQESLETLNGGYLLEGETPKTALMRVARRAEELIAVPNLKNNLFDSLWKGYICLSTPIWCNFGAVRGLPISCFGSYIEDSLEGIYDTLKEVAIMTQKGGGTSSYWGHIREEGAIIKTNGGIASGPVSFLKPYDDTMSKVTQGKTRRGSHAAYQEFSSDSFWEWVKFKDVKSSVLELFPGICLQEEDEEAILRGEPEALKRWSAILESRVRTGLPYIFSAKNANKSESTPLWYGENTKYTIWHSNLCTEIMLPNNKEESFVCDLVSMNLAKYDEWKNTKAVRGAIYLLEAVRMEFIEKTKDSISMQKSRKFAINHGALGLGVLGWHTYLQSKNQPFAGIYANSMTKVIMKDIKEKAERASEKLAFLYGNCPVVEEYNKQHNTNFKRRHTTLLAVAPTTSNAAIMGGVSTGIEPYMANVFLKKIAKTKVLVKNPFLEKLLVEKGYNNTATWDSIANASGSVQHLEFLTPEEKEIFLTFGEINQFEIVKQAALRQKYLDQGQSLNLKIRPDADPKQVSLLYMMGLKLGIKSFYYQRSENILRSGVDTMKPDACISCAG